jgi:hypothetical protein
MLLAVCFYFLCCAPVKAFPTTCKITSLEVQNANVIVRWQGGGTTNQLQRKSSLSGSWENVGLPTTASSATNPVVGPVGFFRVMTVGNSGGADSIAPSVSLLSPGGGSTLSSTVALTAAATDNLGGSGVARVEYYCDGTVPLGTNTIAPYTVSANTTAMPNGAHTLYCKSYDVLGKSTTSGGIAVTVSNGTSTGGQLQWVKTGHGGLGTGVTPANIVMDRSGNTAVGGAFKATVDFGGGVLTSAALNDGFIVKYGPQGDFLWAKRFGGYGDDAANDVAFDSSGNLIVVGTFAGANVDFGGISLTSTYNPSQGQDVVPDVFIAKYSPTGSLLWVKSFGGINGEYGRGVAVDGSDNIIMVGALESANVAFGSFTLSSSGSDDIVLAKLSPQGTVLWAKRYGAENPDQAYSITVDRSGDILLGGQSPWGATDLGGGTVNGGLFVAKYSGLDGSYKWAKTPGSGSVFGIATDPNTGNVIVTGRVGGPTDFGSGPTQSGGVFLTAYSPSGNNLWAKTFNNSTFPHAPNDTGNAVSVDASGNIAFTGTAALVNFGAGWVSYGGYFLANFSSSGTYRWAKGASATCTHTGYGVVFDPLGGIVTTGTYNGTTDLGGITITTSSVNGVPFVARYGP